MVTFGDADWRTVNIEKAARGIQKARMCFIRARKTSTWPFLVINTLGSSWIYIKMQGEDARGRTLTDVTRGEIKIHGSLDLKVSKLNTSGP